jgi:PAS domain S-box-containing protein
VTHFVKGGPGVERVIEPSFAELWEGLSGWALRRLKPALSPKATPDRRETPLVRQRRRETECGAIIVVPLHYGGEIIGTMTAINRPDEPDFTEADVELMMTLGNQAVVAIANARLIESLRESEEKLSSTIASMDDLVFVLDKSGLIMAYHQPSARADLSVLPETFLGQPFQQVLPPAMCDPLERAIKTVMTTHTVQQFDYPLQVAAKEMWFSAKVSQRKDNVDNFAGVTVVVHDITERYELDKMRDEFVSTVSHELRTPLASIMGFLETVLNGRPGPLTEIQQRFLQNSYKSSERLLKLIEELLTISRIQQGSLRLDKHPFSPAEAVQNVHEMVQSLVAAKSIGLEVENQG